MALRRRWNRCGCGTLITDVALNYTRSSTLITGQGCLGLSLCHPLVCSKFAFTTFSFRTFAVFTSYFSISCYCFCSCIFISYIPFFFSIFGHISLIISLCFCMVLCCKKKIGRKRADAIAKIPVN